MPDINDILNLPAPPQTDQPTPAPQSNDIMSQLLGGTSYPQQTPQQNGLAALQQGLNNKLFTQDPAEAYHQFINKIYYGNQDGSEPTKKQKILRPLEDMLEGIIGYQRPELKMLPAAQQAYQEQTGRLGQQTGLEHWLGMLGIGQQKADIAQQNANTNVAKLGVTAAENQARDTARNMRNDIMQLRQKAESEHWSAENTNLAMRTALAKYGMDNPSNFYQFVSKLATSNDPESQEHAKALIQDTALVKMAETPLLTTGSNNSSLQTTDKQGNTVTTNNKANTYSSPAAAIAGGAGSLLQRILGGNAQGPMNNMGIPIANGAPTGAGATTPPFVPPSKPSIPNIPQTQPPTPPVTPPTAPISGIPGMHPLQDNGGDPTDSRFPFKGGTSPKTSADYAADQTARKKRTDQFRSMEFMSASLAQDLMNTIKDGSNNWTGAFNGNPLMQKFRSDFGDISPYEAMGKGDFFNTMMTRARSAVQGAGRMNIPEIKMAGTTTGNQQENARNAALQAADASFKTGVQRLFDQGKVTIQDQQVITKAINAELNRIKSGQISTVRPIEDVIADESTKKTVYDKSGKPFTIPERQLQKVLATGNYTTDKPKGK